MILVCGEALIDLFVGGAAGRGGLPATAAAGGSPFNVAVGLARLGAPAGYFGGLSHDALGAFLLARLAADGVDTAFAKRSAKPTPLFVVSPDAAGHPSYTIHAHDCAERDVTEADLPPALGPEVEALALGSYALAIEPVGGALLALAEREGARRVSASTRTCAPPSSATSAGGATASNASPAPRRSSSSAKRTSALPTAPATIRRSGRGAGSATAFRWLC